MEVKQLAKIAMMTALTVAVSMLVVIPIPATKGIVTLCEVGIYISASLFGPFGGFCVGALSGGMIDLLSGYPQWMLFSFVIHGIQGLIAGYLMQQSFPLKHIVSLVLASLWMIIGYMLATSLLYTWPAGLASIIGNIVQTSFGSIVTLMILPIIQKRNLHQRMI